MFRETPRYLTKVLVSETMLCCIMPSVRRTASSFFFVLKQPTAYINNKVIKVSCKREQFRNSVSLDSCTWGLEDNA